MTILLKDTRERNRFYRFAVVGVIGAVVDFGTYTILNDLLHVPPVMASVFSFMAAIISNFTWNRFWTYPDSRTKPISHQLVQFSVVSLVGLAIRTPIFALFVGPLSAMFFYFPTPSFLPAGFLGDKAALACAVVVVMFWNFFINRYWTYNDAQRL